MRLVFFIASWFVLFLIKCQPCESFLRGFFTNRGSFVYDDTKDAFSQFHELADYLIWDARRAEDAHAHLQDALTLQFNAMYGTDEANLDAWQYICQVLHALPVPTSIDACKEGSDSCCH
jgi:hypothetical protein